MWFGVGGLELATHLEEIVEDIESGVIRMQLTHEYLQRPCHLVYKSIDNVGSGVNQHDFKRNTHKQPFLVAVNAAALGPVLQKPNHGSKNVDIGLETTDCIGEQLRDGVGDAQAVN